MTLDEAIKHCYEKSKGCSKCANEHKQLFEWLKELKYLREKIKIMEIPKCPKCGSDNIGFEATIDYSFWFDNDGYIFIDDPDVKDTLYNALESPKTHNVKCNCWDCKYSWKYGE